MYFTLTNLGLHFDTMIVWGFLMSFLLNVYFYFSSIRVDKSLIITSTMMFLSYFLTNHYIDLASVPETFYIKLIIYDLATLCLIYCLHKSFRLLNSTGFKYVIFGLCINSIFHGLLYIDLMIINNREVWWYWSFYSIGVNAVDVLMACALIMNRDYLGLIRFSKFITSPIRKKAFS